MLSDQAAHPISASSHEAFQIADCRLQIGAGVAR